MLSLLDMRIVLGIHERFLAVSIASFRVFDSVKECKNLWIVYFAVPTKLYMMALASAPRMESTLTQFFRPRVKGWMARSAVLLSMGMFLV